MDFPAEDITQMFDVNVTGTFLVAQAVAKEMRAADVSGSMVFVASMSGYVSNKASEAPFTPSLDDSDWVDRVLIPRATMLRKPRCNNLRDHWLPNGDQGSVCR